MTPFLALFSFFDGMSSGQEPVPDVQNRYGPALTDWERRKWFMDRSTPVDREKKRKDAIRKKRLELGIIEEENKKPDYKVLARKRVDAEMKMLADEEEAFALKLLEED